MSDTFRAIRLHKTDTGHAMKMEELTEADLMEGDVTVRVSHSTINFKDGLALTGKSPVVRVWPMIPGIDFAGQVETSSHPGFKPGDRVEVKALADAHFVLVGGAAMDGPRHIWWNFVSSRQDRIEAAKADWKAGRFAIVPGDTTEFIPLPEGS